MDEKIQKIEKKFLFEDEFIFNFAETLIQLELKKAQSFIIKKHEINCQKIKE